MLAVTVKDATERKTVEPESAEAEIEHQHDEVTKNGIRPRSSRIEASNWKSASGISRGMD